MKIEPPPDPFNLFQNTVPTPDGEFDVGQTLSKAGDYVEFRTEMDVIAVVSACSVDLLIVTASNPLSDFPRHFACKWFKSLSLIAHKKYCSGERDGSR